MKTEITILDRLLGLDQKSRRRPTAPEAQAMLIRGAPGSGKTTLALEILARKITSNETPTFGVFLSLEVDPIEAYKAVLSRLNSDLTARLPDPGKPAEEGGLIKLENEKTILLLAGRKWCKEALPPTTWIEMDKHLSTQLTNIIDKIQVDRLKATKNPRQEALVKSIAHKLEEARKLGMPEEVAVGLRVHPREARRIAPQPAILSEEERAILPFKEGLIVLDTVNLLGEYLLSVLHKQTPEMDMRAIMYGLWSILESQRDSFQKRRYPCNLILVGEQHPGVASDVSLLSESFACDIELLLAAEPIAGTPNTPTNLLGTLGYSFERQQHSKPLSDEPQFVEMRSFCRVLKSRFAPNQSRRCAYDIVSGYGVKFEEKYPGDGAVLLFHENTKQKELWEQFLTKDLPLQFPALRYSLFNRPSLQRIFATQRRLNQLDQKTDMHLACFDTYWVNWYWQLGRRSHLRSLIQAAFPETRYHRNKEELDRWSRFLCGVDQFARDAMLKHPIGEPSKKFDAAFLRMTKSALCKDWFGAQRQEWLKTQSKSDPADKTINGSKPRRFPKDRVLKLFNCVVDAGQDLSHGSVGLLQLIPRKELRLFGERCSPIIEELEREDNCVHLPRFDDKGENYLSVPYNGNVSFLVCRQDLLRTRLPTKDGEAQWKEKLEVLQGRQEAALRQFITAQDEWFEKERKQGDGQWKKEWAYVAKQQNCAKQSAPDKRQEPAPQDEREAARRANTMKKVLSVATWEEVILLCMDGKVDEQDEASARLVIETQTFDSFLCAFLEVFWGCGGELRISPQYEITDVIRTERTLFQAFFLIREMFRLKVIERYSTVEPKQFAERFKDNPNGWLFARHWYSTLVDVLTAQDQPSETVTSNSGPLNLSQKIKPPWSWQPAPEVVWSIQPLPYTQFAAYHEKKPMRPVSCWGEWHLAVLNGTENRTLAIELINHLMGSDAICDRAACCAAIPTVQEFYVRYHDVPCLRLPERGDIVIPTLTYQELRDCIFDVARSRRTIFDYRHCMRELHSVLSLIQHFPEIPIYQPRTPGNQRIAAEPERDLATRILQAVDRIHSLQCQEVLSH